MPWLIDVTDDGTNDFLRGGSSFERVIERDHEELRKTPMQQFGKLNEKGVPTAIDEERMIPFMRAEYEYGRAYYRLKRARKSLPGRAQPNWYCDRFKRILEELEPSKHRFARVDIRMPDGKTAWPEPYWYWRCENFIDAIIPDIGDGDPRRSSNIFWDVEKRHLVDENARNIVGPPAPIDKIVVDEDAVRNAHAWHENGFLFKYSSKFFFLSDQLVDRLRQQGAEKGLQLGHVWTSELSAASGRTSGGVQ